MKKETIQTVAARIARLEFEEDRLELMIQFPPPRCRNVGVWRQFQLDSLGALRVSLREKRELLVRLGRCQLELDFEPTGESPAAAISSDS